MAAGAIGSQFEPGGWYADLNKPSWTPPSWLFGPVWATLYIMMGISAWVIWRAAGLRGAALPLSFFVLQLILNAGWSWVFFGLQRPGLAFAEIVVLWMLIAATMTLFWRRRTLAGALLVPYLAWVSFALALNFAIWQMN